MLLMLFVFVQLFYGGYGFGGYGFGGGDMCVYGQVVVGGFVWCCVVLFVGVCFGGVSGFGFCWGLCLMLLYGYYVV